MICRALILGDCGPLRGREDGWSVTWSSITGLAVSEGSQQRTRMYLRMSAAVGLASNSVTPTLGVFRTASLISECSVYSVWVYGTATFSWIFGKV